MRTDNKEVVTIVLSKIEHTNKLVRVNPSCMCEVTCESGRGTNTPRYAPKISTLLLHITKK